MHGNVRPPYESEVIGCFVAKLAFKAGWHRCNEPLLINLFQQGPWDKRYGDMIAGCKSFLAIEFKRYSDSHGMSQEREKWNRVGLLTHLIGHSALLETANRCHYLAGGLSDIPGEVKAEVFFPALFNDQGWLNENFPNFDQRNFPTTNTDGVIDQILFGNHGADSPSKLMEYLNAISEFRLASDHGGSSGPSLLAVGRHEDGTIVVSNYDELKYQLQPQSSARATHTDPPGGRNRRTIR
jgi:hypothetical protein